MRSTSGIVAGLPRPAGVDILLPGFHYYTLLIIDRCRENNPSLDARDVIVALRDGDRAQLDAWCAGPMWSDIRTDLAELRK